VLDEHLHLGLEILPRVTRKEDAPVVGVSYGDVMGTPALVDVPRTAESLAGIWYDEVESAGRRMSTLRTVPDDVAELVERIAEHLGGEPPRSFFAGTDPYLGQVVLASALACEKALRAASEELASTRLRLGLERLRQALRDVIDESPTADTRSAKEVTRWLGAQVTVPQAQLAALLGVSPRTLQRWLSDSDPAGPDGYDEARLRAVARVTSHLRHVFTAPGVVRWFERPHPQLSNQSPLELLGDPLQLPRLMRLASMSRSTLGS
jgi:putative toxin-antitoxin system antitoxin component (TIGR02293 family)